MKYPKFTCSLRVATVPNGKCAGSIRVDVVGEHPLADFQALESLLLAAPANQEVAPPEKVAPEGQPTPITDLEEKILSPRGEGEKSGILIFTSGNAEKDVALFDYLSENGVFAAPRGGGVRFSPHFYNTDEEVGKVFEIIDAFPA